MFDSTVYKLSQITDVAEFEQIATAVLRSAEPHLYGNLSHQGVNAAGKTVKSPFDGFGWVVINNESMAVGAEHTTYAQGNLARKWLHDPSTVTPRNKSGKPTQLAGDLVKAIDEITKIRQSNPDLKATLALTYNSEEPADVRVKAEELAATNNIVLDIWSGSRIAQYLNTTPEGQVIRHHYFGQAITHLSKSELLRIGNESLKAYQTYLEKDQVVPRNLPDLFDSNTHLILSGASGMGKTTLCLDALSKYLANAQAGLVLSDATVSAAITLEEALDTELHRYSPSLIPNSGFKALELCSATQPLMIVVEDINKSASPERLLNKLLIWMLDKNNAPRTWRLICPVWPQLLVLLDKSKKDAAYKENLIQQIGLYNTEEAHEAIRRRTQQTGLAINELSIKSLAASLGNDPLLIGLYDFQKNRAPTNVIKNFISDELERIAEESRCMLTDFEDAINVLMVQMLEQRNLNPTFREVKSWFAGHNDALDILKMLFKNRRIFRLTKNPHGEVIEARHDRILYYLLANALAQATQQELDASYLFDPYFAEVVGIAAAIGNFSTETLTSIMASNPIAGFYALKYAVSTKSDYLETASNTIKYWLSLAKHQNNTYFHRRYLGLDILAEIDSQLVIELTNCFPSIDHNHNYYCARFRNGDFTSGFYFLTEYPFNFPFPHDLHLIQHIKLKYQGQLIYFLNDLFKNSNTPNRVRRGALILIGYIGEPTLANAVRTAWSLFDGSQVELEIFFWAAAHVFDDHPESLLDPIMDAWELVPDEEDKFANNPIYDFAGNSLRFKFRDHPPKAALPYIIQKAKTNAILKRPILSLLEKIDDPYTLQYIVECSAEQRKINKEKSRNHISKNYWTRLYDEKGQSMSNESKQHLFQLASNKFNDHYLREEAFKLWESSISITDLKFLQTIEKGDIRYSTAIWARVRRNDPTSIPQLLEKIEENSRYWWQAGRYIWSDEMTKALANSISKVTSNDELEEKWIIPELLLKLDPKIIEKLLLPYWSELKVIPDFIQIALLAATPEFLRLVKISVEDAEIPQKIFEFFSLKIISGKRYSTTIEQASALKPYLEYFSDTELEILHDHYVRQGLNDYAKEYLIPILQNRNGNYNGKNCIDTSPLDEALRSGNKQILYDWFKTEVRKGLKKDHIILELNNWLTDNKSIYALMIVGDIISNHGNRADLGDFQSIASSMQNSQSIIDEVRFNVFHRTLI